MKKTDKTHISKLLETENGQIQKLHDIVESAVREEELIIHKLAHPQAEMITSGQKISDKVARFGGSWRFIIIFGVVLFLWILFNSLALQAIFDPYPFILMNLILSCIAALQAPIIMMSQNRQEEKDRQRAENDYLINLKSELEIRTLHQKIDLVLVERFQHLLDIQQQQLVLLTDLQRKIDTLKK